MSEIYEWTGEFKSNYYGNKTVSGDVKFTSTYDLNDLDDLVICIVHTGMYNNEKSHELLGKIKYDNDNNFTITSTISWYLWDQVLIFKTNTINIVNGYITGDYTSQLPHDAGYFMLTRSIPLQE